jgi:ribosomal protein L29
MAKEKTVTMDAMRKKNTKDLHTLLRENYVQYATVLTGIASHKEKNTAQVGRMRRTIARIKTVLAEKQELSALQVKKEK